MRIIIQLCIMLSSLLIVINLFEIFNLSKIYKIIIFITTVAISFYYLDKSEVKFILVGVQQEDFQNLNL